MSPRPNADHYAVAFQLLAHAFHAGKATEDVTIARMNAVRDRAAAEGLTDRDIIAKLKVLR